MAQNILMVCLGNICRSPMADGLLLRKINEKQLDLKVDSAGTANYHIGKAPDLRMIKTAAAHGTPIDFLRARQFNKQDFKNYDLILVMDESNYNDVVRLGSTEEEKQKVDYLLNYLQPGTNAKVPDPYYGTQQDFEAVYDLLDRATDALIHKITHEH